MNQQHTHRATSDTTVEEKVRKVELLISNSRRSRTEPAFSFERIIETFNQFHAALQKRIIGQILCCPSLKNLV